MPVLQNLRFAVSSDIGPVPPCKWFFFLAQQSDSAILEPFFFFWVGVRSFGVKKNWLKVSHWLQTSPQTALVEKELVFLGDSGFMTGLGYLISKTCGCEKNHASSFKGTSCMLLSGSSSRRICVVSFLSSTSETTVTPSKPVCLSGFNFLCGSVSPWHSET